MKQILKVLFPAVILLVILCLVFTASAEELSWSSAVNLMYALDNETLWIKKSPYYSSGEMQNFYWDSTSAWCGLDDVVKHIIIDDGVTNIGNYAFYCFRELESISMGCR